MSARFIVIAIAMSIASYAHTAEKDHGGRYGAKPLKGDYYVYGGTLAEMEPPTRKDRKVSFMLRGDLAKELFNQIGPDAKIACSSAPDYRERRRGDLDCVYSKGDGYTCYFGLDVSSGRSTIGSIC